MQLNLIIPNIGYSISIRRYYMWNHEHKWKHFRRGGLRTWVLAVLQQAPRNGAEVMDQIEIATQGWWRPSPGSVYPLLEELLKDGRIRKRADDRYEITEAGKQEFQWPWGMQKKQPHTVDEVLTEIGGYVSYLEDLAKADNTKITENTPQIKELQARLAKLTGA